MDRYGLHSYETRHAKRVKIYRVVIDFLAFAVLMAIVLIIAVM